MLELRFRRIQVAALQTVRVVDSFLFCLRKVQESLEDQIAKTAATQQWNLFTVVYLFNLFTVAVERARYASRVSRIASVCNLFHVGNLGLQVREHVVEQEEKL